MLVSLAGPTSVKFENGHFVSPGLDAHIASVNKGLQKDAHVQAYRDYKLYGQVVDRGITFKHP